MILLNHQNNCIENSSNEKMLQKVLTFWQSISAPYINILIVQ